MKFQIGDKVKFKKDLAVGRCYDGFGFCSDMGKQKDKIFEIIEIDNEDFRIKAYQEGSDFMLTKYWVTEAMIDMFERVHKRLFVNQSDLKQYGTYSKDMLKKCPKCNDILYWNDGCNDLYADQDHDAKTFKIIMEYCDKCDELYIWHE
jgi:hypothetical protein